MLEPTFAVTANSSDSLAEQIFVLAIVDPDAPTPQNTSISQFRHMLAGDLHVNASSGGALVNSSAALTDFVNPTPPAGSDPHRYGLASPNSHKQRVSERELDMSFFCSRSRRLSM